MNGRSLIRTARLRKAGLTEKELRAAGLEIANPYASLSMDNDCLLCFNLSFPACGQL